MLRRCLREINCTSERIQHATILHHSGIVVGQGKEDFGVFAFQVVNGSYPYIPQFGCKQFTYSGYYRQAFFVCSLVIVSDELHDKVALIVDFPKRIVGYFKYIPVQIIQRAFVSYGYDLNHRAFEILFVFVVMIFADSESFVYSCCFKLYKNERFISVSRPQEPTRRGQGMDALVVLLFPTLKDN